MNKKTNGLFGHCGLTGKFALLSLLMMGCFGAERKPPDAKPVIPVSGIVLVDGAPVAGVQIRFHAAKQDPKNATLTQATTNAEGRFKAFTYKVDDGAPPGDYMVTFNDQSKMKPHERSSPDLFKGKYSDPTKSEFKLTVPENGKPIDMGTIELSH